MDPQQAAWPPVIPFFGPSGSGKTTLLEAVVRRLKERGHRVAVIKHTHHRVQLDRPGKDSWRFGEAGADVVAVSAPDRLATFQRIPRAAGLEHLLPSLAGRVDVVLCEGFKSLGLPGVLVLGERRREDAPRPRGPLLAVVSTDREAAGTSPHFEPDDDTGIAGLVERVAGLTAGGPPAESGPASPPEERA